MPNSLDSGRVLRKVLLEQADLQKCFLKVPIKFRVSCGKQGSRLTIPRRLGILMGVDSDRGILQSCSQFQDHKKKFSLRLRWNLLRSVNPEFWVNN